MGVSFLPKTSNNCNNAMLNLIDADQIELSLYYLPVRVKGVIKICRFFDHQWHEDHGSPHPG
jgi:hypothetical protein